MGFVPQFVGQVAEGYLTDGAASHEEDVRERYRAP
jgi:hypothetical protein